MLARSMAEIPPNQQPLALLADTTVQEACRRMG
jgi:hypothetical protein